MIIDEVITVEEYNPEWPELYELEKQRVVDAFNGIAMGVEHIGSTSVVGMLAKPIIDIMIGVRSLSPGEDIIEMVKKLGYEYFGEISPGRIYCRKRQEYKYNLAIVIYQDSMWKNNILFRDYLRNHPDEVARYSELKNKTVLSGINTLLKYSDEKVELIKELMVKATS